MLQQLGYWFRGRDLIVVDIFEANLAWNALLSLVAVRDLQHRLLAMHQSLVECGMQVVGVTGGRAPRSSELLAQLRRRAQQAASAGDNSTEEVRYCFRCGVSTIAFGSRV